MRETSRDHLVETGELSVPREHGNLFVGVTDDRCTRFGCPCHLPVVESHMTTLVATGRSRMNFANSHLVGANHLALVVQQIEISNAGNPWGDFYEPMLANASAVIMLTVASLEAFLAELQFEPEARFSTQSPELKDEFFELIDRRPIPDRFCLLAMLNGRPKPDFGRRPGQDVATLIDLRNALVHYDPEWSDEKGKHSSLSARLAYKFDRCAWLPDEPLFPRAWVSYSCCQWAVKAVRDFVLEYARDNGWAHMFEKLAQRISLPRLD
jgi:hypothetical protein